MRTLYVRNVPDEMAEAFIELAKREGMSVNAFVLRVLGHVARRARNAAILADLPDHGLTAGEIVSALREARAERDRR